MNTNHSKTHADNIYSPDNSTTATPTPQSVYNPPRYHGEVGWICPVCGRGNAPSTAYCNCNMTKPEIVYANGGLTMKSILDDAIPCNSTPPEAYYTTTATSSPNGKYWAKSDAKLHCSEGAFNF
jgi:hypothetical protein